VSAEHVMVCGTQCDVESVVVVQPMEASSAAGGGAAWASMGAVGGAGVAVPMPTTPVVPALVPHVSFA